MQKHLNWFSFKIVWRAGAWQKKETIKIMNFGAELDQGTEQVFLFYLIWGFSFYLYIFVDISENNPWILMKPIRLFRGLIVMSLCNLVKMQIKIGI